MKALYVYALVPAGLQSPLGEGIDGETLRVAPLGALAAVVGEMEDRPSIAPASLRAHDAIVRRIAGTSDAVLPFRFGAMVTSEQELRDGLAPRLEALAVALERTRGCDQMTLRVYGEGAAPAPARDPSPAGPGTRWLQDRSPQVQLAEIARVREALAAMVRAEVVEPGGRPPLRASVFHLVPRAAIGDYRARVEALSRDLAPGRVDATGPWPPYAFTELE